MSAELELIRGFRVDDGAVDAASSEAARSRLLAHIGAAERSERPAVRFLRRLGPRRLRFEIPRLQFVAGLLAVLVVVGVVAVVVRARSSQAGHQAAAPPAVAAISHGQLRNLVPGGFRPLPGGVVCNADLAPPGVTAGTGGPRSGVIIVTDATVAGVDESPFSLTAKGLTPTTHGNLYAVWITPAASLGAGGYVLQNGAMPQLLGRIVPGVGADGKLAVEGLLPAGVNGFYLFRVTLQPSGTTATPGRTVLEGYVFL